MPHRKQSLPHRVGRETPCHQAEPADVRQRNEGAIPDLYHPRRVGPHDLHEQADDEDRRFRIQRIGQKTGTSCGQIRQWRNIADGGRTAGLREEHPHTEVDEVDGADEFDRAEQP